MTSIFSSTNLRALCLPIPSVVPVTNASFFLLVFFDDDDDDDEADDIVVTSAFIFLLKQFLTIFFITYDTLSSYSKGIITTQWRRRRNPLCWSFSERTRPVSRAIVSIAFSFFLFSSRFGPLYVLNAD